MIVPLGFSGDNNARKIVYDYDNAGKQSGMEVLPETVTSSTTLEAGTSAGQTQFSYDNSSSRVKMITKPNGSGYAGTYYFVYDPAASVPAVVYEQGPANRYLNVREPGGELLSRETYDSNGIRIMELCI